jgi:hypothetical protein
MPFEEGLADFGLEALELLGDSGRSVRERPGGGRDRPLLHDLEEHLQPSYIDHDFTPR